MSGARGKVMERPLCALAGPPSVLDSPYPRRGQPLSGSARAPWAGPLGAAYWARGKPCGPTRLVCGLPKPMSVLEVPGPARRGAGGTLLTTGSGAQAGLSHGLPLGGLLVRLPVCRSVPVREGRAAVKGHGHGHSAWRRQALAARFVLCLHPTRGAQSTAHMEAYIEHEAGALACALTAGALSVAARFQAPAAALQTERQRDLGHWEWWSRIVQAGGREGPGPVGPPPADRSEALHGIPALPRRPRHAALCSGCCVRPFPSTSLAGSLT